MRIGNRKVLLHWKLTPTNQQPASVVKRVSLKFQFVKTSKCLQLPTPGSMSRLWTLAKQNSNILLEASFSLCQSIFVVMLAISNLKENAIKAVILIPLTILWRLLEDTKQDHLWWPCHVMSDSNIVLRASDIHQSCLTVCFKMLMST